MTDFQTSWIQMAFYGSYFFLAFPAALLIKKFHYKTGVLTGLGMYIMGALAFYPASLTMNYGHFLASLFVLAGGLAILETSANPYILVMGDPESATRRLNLAQSFNPLGSITGVVLSKFFILSQLTSYSEAERQAMEPVQLEAVQQQELNAVMTPYVGVAVLLIFIWLMMRLSKMPSGHDSQGIGNLRNVFIRLLSNRNYLYGVLGLLFYMGAQIGVWSFIIRYVMQTLDVNEDDASTYYIASLILFAGSRFICTWLMKFISPQKLLFSLALIASVLTLTVMFSDGLVGVYALVLISGCLSLMFPTIFSFAVKGLGEDTKIGGSIVIMMIVGGALFPPIQGLISDASTIQYSFVIPLLCFGIVLSYARYVIRNV